MGQRLTIDILDNGEKIAIIYYHWSAYFVSTIYELKDVKDDIAKAKAEGKDVLLAIIDGLERRGGGLDISPRTREAAKKEWPDREFKTDINRNDGLICIEEKDIEETFNMSEGWASIDISTEEVGDEVDLEMDLHFKVPELPVNPFDHDMSFEELDKLYEYIKAEVEKSFKKG